jgi:hypothetical protein
MASNARYANGHRMRQLRAELAARHEPCWICQAFGLPGDIDYSLPANDPRSFELDHLVPVSRGGSIYDPKNCAATHRRCNEWRSNRTVAQVYAAAAEAKSGGTSHPKPQTTTDWLS